MSFADKDEGHETVDLTKAERAMSKDSLAISNDSDSQGTLSSPQQQNISINPCPASSFCALKESKRSCVNQKRREKLSLPERESAQVGNVETKIIDPPVVMTNIPDYKGHRSAGDSGFVDEMRTDQIKTSKDSTFVSVTKGKQRRSVRAKHLSVQSTLAQFFDGETVAVASSSSLETVKNSDVAGTFDADKNVSRRTRRQRRSEPSNKEEEILGRDTSSTSPKTRSFSSSTAELSSLSKSKRQRNSYPPTSVQTSSEVKATEKDAKSPQLKAVQESFVPSSVCERRESDPTKYNRPSLTGDRLSDIPVQGKRIKSFRKLPSSRNFSHGSPSLSQYSPGLTKRNAKGETPLHVACIKVCLHCFSYVLFFHYACWSFRSL